MTDLTAMLDELEKKANDHRRCVRCGWPLHDHVRDGCTKDNCSQRPLPEIRYPRGWVMEIDPDVIIRLVRIARAAHECVMTARNTNEPGFYAMMALRFAVTGNQHWQETDPQCAGIKP